MLKQKTNKRRSSIRKVDLNNYVRFETYMKDIQTLENIVEVLAETCIERKARLEKLLDAIKDLQNMNIWYRGAFDRLKAKYKNPMNYNNGVSMPTQRRKDCV